MKSNSNSSGGIDKEGEDERSGQLGCLLDLTVTGPRPRKNKQTPGYVSFRKSYPPGLTVLPGRPSGKVDVTKRQVSTDTSQGFTSNENQRQSGLYDHLNSTLLTMLARTINPDNQDIVSCTSETKTNLKGGRAKEGIIPHGLLRYGQRNTKALFHTAAGHRHWQADCPLPPFRIHLVKLCHYKSVTAVAANWHQNRFVLTPEGRAQKLVPLEAALIVTSSDFDGNKIAYPNQEINNVDDKGVLKEELPPVYVPLIHFACASNIELFWYFWRGDPIWEKKGTKPEKILAEKKNTE
ncbi:unnamed protein product [Dovyalis caffra]|uniref:Uncharacterized protein n=1 Tax=Dovyalis caffra TaxID=77055 RepID=A0AAV1R182_9ROSI|nr:unnamed protein product [Dovyalis caffra]